MSGDGNFWRKVVGVQNLIRFDRYQEAWWDKSRDADDHYELFPLSQTQLEQNEYLKQNPGYPDISR